MSRPSGRPDDSGREFFELCRKAQEMLRNVEDRGETLRELQRLFADFVRRHREENNRLLCASELTAELLLLCELLEFSRSSACNLLRIDSKTGLLNEDGLKFYAAKFEEIRRETGQQYMYILSDIVKFGEFNNVHGMAVADEVLKDVGEFLSIFARTKDVVGRLHGDEFEFYSPCDTQSKSLNNKKLDATIDRLRSEAKKFGYNLHIVGACTTKKRDLAGARKLAEERLNKLKKSSKVA